MHFIVNRRSTHGYRRLLGVLLLCVVAALALHHLALHHHDDSSPDHPCPLCVLLSTALLVPLALVALLQTTTRSFAPVRTTLPPHRTQTWTAWSHRGPPALSSH